MSNYLYNGVRLPKLPESDLPYMYIYQNGESGGYVLVATQKPCKLEQTKAQYGELLPHYHTPLTVSDDGIAVEYTGYVAYENYTEWDLRSENKIMPNGLRISLPIIWSNYDFCYNDGEVYVAASPAPIPVLPLDPTALLMGWMVGKRVAGLRKTQTDVPVVPDEPDVPTGVYDDTEPVTWNSLVVTNNGAKFDYEGTPMVKISNLYGNAYDFNKYNKVNITVSGTKYTATLQGTQEIEGCIGAVYVATVGTQTMQLVGISVPAAGTYAGIDIPEAGIYATDYGVLMPDTSIDFESAQDDVVVGVVVTDEYIKCDGNTEGLETVPYQVGDLVFGLFYKVSDKTPSSYVSDYTALLAKVGEDEIVISKGSGGLVAEDKGDYIDISDGGFGAYVVTGEQANINSFVLTHGVWFFKTIPNDALEITEFTTLGLWFDLYEWE